MTDDEFDVIKNVNESFSITIPGFHENVPPAGTIYSFTTITDAISLAVGTPSTTQTMGTTLGLTSPTIDVGTPVLTTVGPSVLPLTAAVASKTILQGVPSRGLSTEGGSGSGVWIGTETTGGAVTGRYKNWFPFSVALSRNTVITSATITVYVVWIISDASIKIGCDNRGNSLTPTSYDELNMITLTPSYTSIANFSAVAGLVSYDITGSVQEVLNNVNWSSGNTLGVVIYGNSDTTGSRWIATFGNGTYAAPELIITYP